MLGAFIAAAFLATVPQSYPLKWYIVGFDKNYVSFVYGASISGPPDRRVITGLTIYGIPQSIEKAIEYDGAINCQSREMIKFRYRSYAGPNRLVDSWAPSDGWNRIIPKSVGENMRALACEPSEGDWGNAWGSLSEPYVVTERAMRLMNMNLSAEASVVLAASNAKLAPETAELALNAYVPLEKQPFVRVLLGMEPAPPPRKPKVGKPCSGKPKRVGTPENPVMYHEWADDPDFFCAE